MAGNLAYVSVSAAPGVSVLPAGRGAIGQSYRSENVTVTVMITGTAVPLNRVGV